MILKLLLVIGVIGAVYFFFIKKKPIRNQSDKPKNKKSKNQEANDMVECAACGTYAELGDSILSNNKYYCSSECVDKA